MLQKPLKAIAVDDVLRLVLDGVPEARTLEYKRALPGGSDADRREFLADVASLANAAGGDLIFGVEGGRDERGKSNGHAAGAPGARELQR
jgi:predicted HTH transcriptional regulator